MQTRFCALAWALKNMSPLPCCTAFPPQPGMCQRQVQILPPRWHGEKPGPASGPGPCKAHAGLFAREIRAAEPDRPGGSGRDSERIALTWGHTMHILLPERGRCIPEVVNYSILPWGLSAHFILWRTEHPITPPLSSTLASLHPHLWGTPRDPPPHCWPLSNTSYQ